MEIALLPLSYFVWHYTIAFKDIWRFFTNIIWFFWNFFSIKLLSKTLFSPWRRMTTDERSRNKAWNFFADFVMNSLMRVIGFFMRVFTICLGLLIIVLTILAAVTFYVSWIVLPFAILALIFSGVQMLL